MEILSTAVNCTRKAGFHEHQIINDYFISDLIFRNGAPCPYNVDEAACTLLLLGTLKSQLQSLQRKWTPFSKLILNHRIIIRRSTLTKY